MVRVPLVIRRKLIGGRRNLSKMGHLTLIVFYNTIFYFIEKTKILYYVKLYEVTKLLVSFVILLLIIQTFLLNIKIDFCRIMEN